MTILSAQTILSLCHPQEVIGIEPMLKPFYVRTRHEGVTFGLSASGYDVRVEFDKEGEIGEIELSPGEFLLASTMEQFHMPTDIVGVVHDKSSWARRGIAVQNTVIEPGWSGFLTLEITNHGIGPVRLVRGMGIAQILFHRLDSPTIIPYDGKYQAQERGPVEAKRDDW